MPKRSIYFKDEEDALYLKVKELTEETGETVASVFVDAMQEYIRKKETVKLGFKPIKLFIGVRQDMFGDIGEEIEFTGKLIGSGTKQEDVQITETLYKTLKKKFLLHIQIFDDRDLSTTTKFKIFETAEDLKNEQFPPEITNGLREGSVTTRRLDI